MLDKTKRHDLPHTRRGTTQPGIHRVLVAGGAGFIGSHLCDRLVRDGHEVVCLDSLQTGARRNIQPLLNHASFTFIEADVRHLPPLPGTFSRIYNLACPASPPHYQRDPIATMQICVNGAINLLDRARCDGARILQASTSEVYGDPEIHPQPEHYVGHVNPNGPRACYDEGKRAAETLFFDFHRMHKVDIKVARIFNTYGPRMLENDGRVISNFVVQALQGRPLTMYGNGSQTRSFCYVDDLVEGLVALMESGPSVTGPCNLGNPEERTVADIAALIIAMTGSTSRVVQQPLPPDDPRRRRPLIDFAAERLGWAPRTSLEDGLRRTIEYFASAKVRFGEDAPARPHRGVRTSAALEHESNVRATP